MVVLMDDMLSHAASSGVSAERLDFNQAITFMSQFYYQSYVRSGVGRFVVLYVGSSSCSSPTPCRDMLHRYTQGSLHRACRVHVVSKCSKTGEYDTAASTRNGMVYRLRRPYMD
jgi:hypothetical protein